MWRRSLRCALLLAACLGESGAGELDAECQAYLAGKGLSSPAKLQALLETCTPNSAQQAEYAPNPASSIPGVTDTTPLSCKYGHPSLQGPTGGTCCGWKPHFNWVVATCDANSGQNESLFCRNVPACVHKDGEAGCGAKINYVAAYQFDGEEFVLLDDSTAGDISPEGVAGDYAAGTGWEKRKSEFAWKNGDWTSKYAPWGDGPNGPRGGTPPGMMWVLSADSFYYGAFFMLSQLTLNLEGKGWPTGTNCWNWEWDPVEGSIGWMMNGDPLPGNLNQLYSTNNAAVSGCMPVAYMASQANGNRRTFSQPDFFKEYCTEHPTAAGCEPWIQDVMWSGGFHSTHRMENFANQPYVWAMVVDHRGFWIYRWIPDAHGKTGWDGIELNKAARVLPKRPKAVKDPRGLATNVRGDVKEAVILQPSVPPSASCLRASVEPANFQFGADALGAMAAQLGEYQPGGALEGAQNWWAHFQDTEQYQGYPLSIAGVPVSELTDQYTCNKPGLFTCDCKVHDTPPVAVAVESNATPSALAAPALEAGRSRSNSTATTTTDLVKGISYGPMPCRGPCTAQQDDFMAEQAKHLWGRRGRGDLQIMRQLGANNVRTYGNNPENDHTGFLNEAMFQGLKVSVGNSDYPFIQSPTNCLTTSFNCYSQMNESYSMSLRTGFLREDGTYHPAIREVIVINEPELKLGLAPSHFIKAVITSIDAMLDAEQAAGVQGRLPNFTVTFSYAICTPCSFSNTVPGLAQMQHLRDAMLRPHRYGYSPNNDLATFYRTRFTNSFNTANPARDIKTGFLEAYERDFPSTPVMIQEYHRPYGGPTEDLSEMIQIAAGSQLLLGASFFEFQVRYDKGGSELDFGMFGFGDYELSDFDYFGTQYSAWCLIPRKQEGESIPEALRAAYGGEGTDYAAFCTPDPEKVPLSAKGLQNILSQRNSSTLGAFVARVVSQLGGAAADAGGLALFSREFLAAGAQQQGFGDLLSRLSERPRWARWPLQVACVADREASTAEVGQAVSWLCGQMGAFNCSRDVPDECSAGLWQKADYVFGLYYSTWGQGSAGLDGCYFKGAARLSAELPPGGSGLPEAAAAALAASGGRGCGELLWSGQDQACGGRCRRTPGCERYTSNADGLCRLLAAEDCGGEEEPEAAATAAGDAPAAPTVEVGSTSGSECTLLAARNGATRRLVGNSGRGGDGGVGTVLV